MVRAVNQHAGDTGRSHLANRYFFGSLHRGWLLDELDKTEAALTRRERSILLESHLSSVMLARL